MHKAAGTLIARRAWLCLLATLFFAALPMGTPAVAGEMAQAPATEAPPNAVTNPAKDEHEPTNPNPLPEGQTVGQTIREQVLSIAILSFGLVVLGVQYLLLRNDPRRPAQEILQLLSINLIITGTLFMISAGLSAQDIAPGLGLFGTIAGYVLGRRASDDAKTRSNQGGETR